MRTKEELNYIDNLEQDLLVYQYLDYLLQLSILKATKKSSYIIKAALYQLQIIYTSSIRYLTIVSIDLFALLPIQASSRSFFSLAIVVSYHITTASIILPIRFSSKINYQPFIVPISSQVLPFFLRTTIFIQQNYTR